MGAASSKLSFLSTAIRLNPRTVRSLLHLKPNQTSCSTNLKIFSRFSVEDIEAWILILAFLFFSSFLKLSYLSVQLIKRRRIFDFSSLFCHTVLFITLLCFTNVKFAAPISIPQTDDLGSSSILSLSPSLPHFADDFPASLSSFLSLFLSFFFLPSLQQ